MLSQYTTYLSETLCGGSSRKLIAGWWYVAAWYPNIAEDCALGPPSPAAFGWWDNQISSYVWVSQLYILFFFLDNVGCNNDNKTGIPFWAWRSCWCSCPFPSCRNDRSPKVLPPFGPVSCSWHSVWAEPWLCANFTIPWRWDSSWEASWPRRNCFLSYSCCKCFSLLALHSSLAEVHSWCIPSFSKEREREMIFLGLLKAK